MIFTDSKLFHVYIHAETDCNIFVRKLLSMRNENWAPAKLGLEMVIRFNINQPYFNN